MPVFPSEDQSKDNLSSCIYILAHAWHSLCAQHLTSIDPLLAGMIKIFNISTTQVHPVSMSASLKQLRHSARLYPVNITPSCQEAEGNNAGKGNWGKFDEDLILYLGKCLRVLLWTLYRKQKCRNPQPRQQLGFCPKVTTRSLRTVFWNHVYQTPKPSLFLPH